jgi:hypothetical protein
MTVSDRVQEHATCGCGCCGPANDQKAASEASKGNERTACRCGCGCGGEGECNCGCTDAGCTCGCR